MKRGYSKYDEVVNLLLNGWEIFTERGSAPYEPLYYYIYAPYSHTDDRKRVHPNTITSLIKKNIIHGTDRKHGKYSLINQ